MSLDYRQVQRCQPDCGQTLCTACVAYGTGSCISVLNSRQRCSWSILPFRHHITTLVLPLASSASLLVTICILRTRVPQRDRLLLWPTADSSFRLHWLRGGIACCYRVAGPDMSVRNGVFAGYRYLERVDVDLWKVSRIRTNIRWGQRRRHCECDCEETDDESRGNHVSSAGD